MKKLVGIGQIARELGISREAVRHHLVRGHAPEPKLRGPSGARLFSDSEARAVIESIRGVAPAQEHPMAKSDQGITSDERRKG